MTEEYKAQQEALASETSTLGSSGSDWQFKGKEECFMRRINRIRRQHGLKEAPVGSPPRRRGSQARLQTRQGRNDLARRRRREGHQVALPWPEHRQGPRLSEAHPRFHALVRSPRQLPRPLAPRRCWRRPKEWSDVRAAGLRAKARPGQHLAQTLGPHRPRIGPFDGEAAAFALWSIAAVYAVQLPKKAGRLGETPGIKNGGVRRRRRLGLPDLLVPWRARPWCRCACVRGSRGDVRVVTASG